MSADLLAPGASFQLHSCTQPFSFVLQASRVAYATMAMVAGCAANVAEKAEQGELQTVEIGITAVQLSMAG